MIEKHSSKMSAGVRSAGRPLVAYRPEFKGYRSEFFGEAADIYVDLHLGLRFSKSVKSS